MDLTGRGLLVITIPALLLGGWLLFKAIGFVTRLGPTHDLGAWPVVAEQQIALDATGPVELCLEGPRFSRLAAGLRFRLSEAGSGAEVPGEAILIRVQSSTFDRVRTAARAFSLPGPGGYLLQVEGLDPARDYAPLRLCFRRPMGLGLVAGVLGILAGAFLAIGGLVFSALAWTGVLARAGH